MNRKFLCKSWETYWLKPFKELLVWALSEHKEIKQTLWGRLDVVDFVNDEEHRLSTIGRGKSIKEMHSTNSALVARLGAGQGYQARYPTQHRRWREIKEDTWHQLLGYTHIHGYTLAHTMVSICTWTHTSHTNTQIKSKGGIKLFSDKQKLTDFNFYC